MKVSGEAIHAFASTTPSPFVSDAVGARSRDSSFVSSTWGQPHLFKPYVKIRLPKMYQVKFPFIGHRQKAG